MEEHNQLCETLLNKTPNGRLEIWYGTGNNGKTTLLDKLKSKYNSYLTIGPCDADAPMYQGVECELLVWRQSIHPEWDLDELLEIAEKRKFNYKRFILETNSLEGLMINDERVEIYPFKHTFNQ